MVQTIRVERPQARRRYRRERALHLAFERRASDAVVAQERLGVLEHELARIQLGRVRGQEQRKDVRRLQQVHQLDAHSPRAMLRRVVDDEDVARAQEADGDAVGDEAKVVDGAIGAVVAVLHAYGAVRRVVVMKANDERAGEASVL